MRSWRLVWCCQFFGSAFMRGMATAEKLVANAVVDRIEVDDGEVRIVGRKEVLAQAVLASRLAPPGVHSFEPSRMKQ